KQTSERLGASWEVLSTASIDQPDSRIWRLPILSQADRQQLLQWNQTETDFPRHRTLGELFEQQAGIRQEAVAAVYEDEHLTYGELERRSNQLGHYLRS